jgi:CheY-like chemotaxis protein
MPGTEVLKKLREKTRPVKIIALTACDSDEMLFETLEYGQVLCPQGKTPTNFPRHQIRPERRPFISPKLAKTIVKDYLFATRQRKASRRYRA